MQRIVIIKKSALYPQIGEWRNWYLIESQLSGDDSEHLARALLACEQGIHFNHVEFVRMLCSDYQTGGGNIGGDGNETTGESSTRRVWEPQPAFRFGNRETDTPSDASEILYVRKQVLSGKNGRSWYRGCLPKSDILIDDKEQYHLLNAPSYDLMLSQVFATLPDGIASLLVEHRGIALAVVGATEPVQNMIARGAIHATGVDRAKTRVPTFRKSAAETIGILIIAARSKIQNARERIALANDLNGVDIQQDLIQCLNLTIPICSSARDVMTKDKNGDCQNGPQVQTRYGPQAETIIQAAESVVVQGCGNNSPKDKFIEDMQALTEVMPTGEIVGVPYWNAAAVSEMLEIVTPYFRAAEICASGDFLISLPKGEHI